jgi:hypothetical protein
MTKPFRLAVFAVLTAFLIPSAPTNSVAADAPIPTAKIRQPSCGDSTDCPKTDKCSIKVGKKTGICVPADQK